MELFLLCFLKPKRKFPPKHSAGGFYVNVFCAWQSSSGETLGTDVAVANVGCRNWEPQCESEDRSVVPSRG